MMQGVREDAAEFLGFEPVAVLGDMANAFSDYICDAGDAIEAALKQQPELAGKQREIEQGVERWVMKMQRAADTSFDRFEASALEQCFNIPHDLQPASSAEPVSSTGAEDEEAEATELWAQLQQRVAVKRELKRRLASLRRLELSWEAQRATLDQLSSLHRTEDVRAVLEKAQRLHETLQSGLGASGAAGSSRASGPAKAGALQTQYPRETISTGSVADLKLLSTALCA